MGDNLKQNISDKSTFFQSKAGRVNCYSFGEDKDSIRLSLEYLLNEKKGICFSSITLLDKNQEKMLSYAFKNPNEVLLFADAIKQLYKKITKAYDIKDDLENKSEIL